MYTELSGESLKVYLYHGVNHMLNQMIRQFHQNPLMWQYGLTSSWH